LPYLFSYGFVLLLIGASTGSAGLGVGDFLSVFLGTRAADTASFLSRHTYDPCRWLGGILNIGCFEGAGFHLGIATACTQLDWVSLRSSVSDPVSTLPPAYNASLHWGYINTSCLLFLYSNKPLWLCGFSVNQRGGEVAIICRLP